MRNMLDEYARAYGTYIANLGNNAVTRSVSALDQMQNGSYGTPELMRDVYEYWRDLVDFNVPIAMGMIPAASMEISSWVGQEFSNFVRVPVLGGGHTFELTDMVNADTGDVLAGFDTDAHGGENAVRIVWTAGDAGPNPGPGSPNNGGLFQGGLYETDGAGYYRLVATVYARLNL